jgi:ribonuclease HII
MTLIPDSTDRSRLIAGVDEAGRGPLAGPVCAAAVILDPRRPLPGIGDSKTISPIRREALEYAIKAQCLAWSVAFASAAEIDAINILQASLLAMGRAVAALERVPGRVLVDGNRAPACLYPVQTIVRGDAIIPAIGAASILAKVARDRLMRQLDQDYPGYGFAAHKGYPTLVHRAALQRLGPCPEHRRTFAPVRELLAIRPSPYSADPR